MATGFTAAEFEAVGWVYARGGVPKLQRGAPLRLAVFCGIARCGSSVRRRGEKSYRHRSIKDECERT
jgi:hypothetical protein